MLESGQKTSQSRESEETSPEQPSISLSTMTPCRVRRFEFPWEHRPRLQLNGSPLIWRGRSNLGRNPAFSTPHVSPALASVCVRKIREKWSPRPNRCRFLAMPLRDWRNHRALYRRLPGSRRELRRNVPWDFEIWKFRCRASVRPFPFAGSLLICWLICRDFTRSTTNRSIATNRLNPPSCEAPPIPFQSSAFKVNGSRRRSGSGVLETFAVIAHSCVASVQRWNCEIARVGRFDYRYRPDTIVGRRRHTAARGIAPTGNTASISRLDDHLVCEIMSGRSVCSRDWRRQIRCDDQSDLP